MFQKCLKQLRESKNLTQKNLAEILNLTQSTIAYYETGQKLPTIENLLAIAKFFDVSTDFLLGVSNDDYSIKKNYAETTRENANPYNTSSIDYSKLIGYYDRLNNENQDYIIGKMIELYKDQTSTKRHLSNNLTEIDDDIAHELESYRKELLSKRNANINKESNKAVR